MVSVPERFPPHHILEVCPSPYRNHIAPPRSRGQYMSDCIHFELMVLTPVVSFQHIPLKSKQRQWVHEENKVEALTNWHQPNNRL